jgi:hypothetical protein
MIEDVTTALQAFASTGNGFTLTLRDARFLTYYEANAGKTSTVGKLNRALSYPAQIIATALDK